MEYRKFCFFDSVLIFAFLSTLGITRANNDKYKLCTSEICIKTGNEIMKGLDLFTDPCSDFFQHVCGRWLENHPPPSDLQTWNQRTIVEANIPDQLLVMLEDAEMKKSEAMLKVRNYYYSCLKIDDNGDQSLDPLEAIVLANGGWPLFQTSESICLKDKLTFQQILENYGKLTGYALFSFEASPAPDPASGTYFLMPFNDPTTPIKRYKSSFPHTAYFEYIMAVAEAFATSGGYVVPTADLKRDVEEMLGFESSLTDLYYNVMNTSSKSVQHVSIGQVQKSWNAAFKTRPEYSIDWLKFINNALNGKNKKVNSRTDVGVYDLDIVCKLAALMGQYELRTVESYIHWYAIDLLAYDTNKKMREITNKFYKQIGIQYYEDADWYLYCIKNHPMRVGLSYAYVHKYMSEEEVSQGTVMASMIKSQLREQLEESPWLDCLSKPQSQRKVDRMDLKIGYSKKYDKPEKIDDFYHELQVSTDYFKNSVNAKKFNMRTLMNKLWSCSYSDTAKDEWQFEASTVMMAYSRKNNYILIPAANFQPPWFHLDRPMVFNYGSIGARMAHQAAHAFDTIGRLIDDNGIERQWWPTSTITIYNGKTQCFVKQYDRYEIDGSMTLNENIADNVGVKTALKAYLFYKTNQTLEDIRIPVLQNYTDMQVFFYSLGNALCGKSQYNKNTSKRTPYKFRINGVVSNMPEFSEAFHCSDTSRMNPSSKCDLWG